MICNSLTLLPGKSVQHVAFSSALSCRTVSFVLVNDVSITLPKNFSVAFSSTSSMLNLLSQGPKIDSGVCVVLSRSSRYPH